MKPINIRLIDDDLVVYAVNVMMFSFEDVCKFTESDWLKVLDRYEMQYVYHGKKLDLIIELREELFGDEPTEEDEEIF